MVSITRAESPSVDRETVSLPPPSGASEAAVAAYVYSTLLSGPEDPDIFDTARRFCETEGFATRPGFSVGGVLTELEVLAANAYAYQLLESWGPIPSDPWAWMRLGQGDCPKAPRWHLSMRTGRFFPIEGPCGLLTCSGCAPSTAEEHFAHAVLVFRKVPTVYLMVYREGNARFEEALRQRRSREQRKLGRAIGYLRVHRPGEIHLYSTDPLGRLGDDVLLSTEVSPLNALRLLRGITLALPLLEEVRWGNQWARTTKPSPPRVSRVVGMASHRNARAAERIARKALKAQTGSDPEDLTPDRLEVTYLPLLASALLTVRGQSRP